MKEIIRSKLDVIKKSASAFKDKEKFQKRFLLSDLHSMWSEIYIPLIKSGEFFQELSKKLKILNTLPEKIDSDVIKYKKYCHRLVISSIKDLLSIVYSEDKKLKTINFFTLDFTLLLSFFQMHAEMFEKFDYRFRDHSFTRLSKYYEPLFLLHIVFVSQHHFIQSALSELNKKIKYFILKPIDYKYEFKYNDAGSFSESLLDCKNSSSTFEENRVISLFFKAKGGYLIQSLTTYQMAGEYQACDRLEDRCLIVLP